MDDWTVVTVLSKPRDTSAEPKPTGAQLGGDVSAPADECMAEINMVFSGDRPKLADKSGATTDRLTGEDKLVSSGRQAD